MKNLEQFIDAFVKIEYQKDVKAYGYNPYHFTVTGQDDKVAAGVLMGMDSSESCYAAVGAQMKDQPKSMFLAMDFPPAAGIPTDFVAIFYYLQDIDGFGCIAQPYDAKSGAQLPRLTALTHEGLKMLLSQCIAGLAMGRIGAKR